MSNAKLIRFDGAVYRLAARPGKLDEHAVDELLIYIDNDKQLYDILHDSVWKKLARHVDIGDYDSEAATFATGSLAEMAARKYSKESAGGSTKWYVLFPTNVRKEVAKELVKKFEDSADEFDDAYWNERRYKKYHNEPFVEKLNKLLGRPSRQKKGNRKMRKSTKVAKTIQYNGAVYRLAHEVSEAGGKTHKDVEYAVTLHDGSDKYFDKFDDAAAAALSTAISGGEAKLDVLIHSEDGAMAYGGDDAFERYQEDPEASVFERFEIKVNAVGRVP